MRIACRITKATNIHSECVILAAFPLQQCLLERPSMLRYMYVHCLSSCYAGLVKSIPPLRCTHMCGPQASSYELCGLPVRLLIANRMKTHTYTCVHTHPFLFTYLFAYARLSTHGSFISTSMNLLVYVLVCTCVCHKWNYPVSRNIREILRP